MEAMYVALSQSCKDLFPLLDPIKESRLQIPAEFRSDSVILPLEIRNLQLYIPDFSGVLSLCHSPEPAVFHDHPIVKRA
jgi:hypothetical protein